MLRFNHAPAPWGDFVEPKINLPDVLRKEAHKAKGKRIMFSSVTDCYQPVEREFQITRECLKILSGQDCSISILTKSALAMRDADLAGNFRQFAFGMSASFHNERTRLHFEKDSSTLDRKAETLKTMKQAGAKTWAFISPVLPDITDFKAILQKLSGFVDSVSFESYNPYPTTFETMKKSLSGAGIDSTRFFKQTKDPYYWQEMKVHAEEVCSDLGIEFDEFYIHSTS